MELKELLNDIQGLLFDITGSRKASIGSLNNVYSCQLNRKRCDVLLVELQRHITSAIHTDVEKWCNICGFYREKNTNFCAHCGADLRCR